MSHSDDIKKVYKLYIPGLEEFCYVGSTQTPLPYRLSLHKSQAHLKNQTKTRACVLFEENNEVVIELIEEMPPGATKEEMEIRERYWIEQYPECLNKNIPGRTWQERWEKNKEHNTIVHKAWVANNKEHIANYNATYAPIKKEKERIRESLPETKIKRSEAKKKKAVCTVCQKEMNQNSLWTHINTVHKKPQG